MFLHEKYADYAFVIYGDLNCRTAYLQSKCAEVFGYAEVNCIDNHGSESTMTVMRESQMIKYIMILAMNYLICVAALIY